MGRYLSVLPVPRIVGRMTSSVNTEMRLHGRAKAVKHAKKIGIPGIHLTEAGCGVYCVVGQLGETGQWACITRRVIL